MFHYDPVCGRKINRNRAYVRLKYKNETYYLCCPICQSEFEKDPEKHLAKRKHKNRRSR